MSLNCETTLPLWAKSTFLNSFSFFLDVFVSGGPSVRPSARYHRQKHENYVEGDQLEPWKEFIPAKQEADRAGIHDLDI